MTFYHEYAIINEPFQRQRTSTMAISPASVELSSEELRRVTCAEEQFDRDLHAQFVKGGTCRLTFSMESGRVQQEVIRRYKEAGWNLKVEASALIFTFEST